MPVPMPMSMPMPRFPNGRLKYLIEMSKQKDYSRIATKLTMIRKSPKTYWSL